jgi:DNA primase catalytic core
MARIADDELERLKREVSIQRLVEARGVKLRRHGKDLVGLCPFHDDKRPSLVVTPDMNLWHCLGACQAGGSVVDWVMKAEGVSFRHAVELLRADAPGIDCDPRRSRGRQQGLVPKRSSVRKLEAPFERSESDETLLVRVVDFYHATLKDSPEALGYLQARGLDSSEMIERFRLGYANRTLGYRLPTKHRKEGVELRSRLEALGVVRPSGHEHLNGSLVVPVFDQAGRVVEMYGRKITSQLRKGTPLHLYLPGPHRGVFHLEALQASQEIILCESLIDALSFWCAGLRNVTASYGVSGFTAEHKEALRRYETKRLYIAYDRDEAGDRAAAALAEDLGPLGLEIYRVLFPRGMDANDYALKAAPASESLAAAVRNAEWMAGKRAPTVVCLPAAAPAEEATKKETSAEAPRPFPLAASEPQRPASEAQAETPPPPVPPAAPAPKASASKAERDEAGEVHLAFGDRQWRIRGLDKNKPGAELRINALVRREAAFHVDTLDLYSARQRAAFLRTAAAELGVGETLIKQDLGAVLLELERLLAEAAAAEAAPKPAAPELSEAERTEALAFLRSPRLVERLLEDFEQLGVVGERDNKLVLYLSAISRKLDEPLAVVIQSSSAAGKSSLMEAVLSLVPEEDRIQYSAMTGQSLFYMGESDLRHKVLAIVEEEGAERASYALKLLQSEGELTIASTGKDPQTGRLVTEDYRVEGPVMIMLTTTAIDVDEELLNRCLVLSVDEGRAQTRAIHARQRRAQTLAGMLEGRERAAIVKRHQNAQRLLRPLVVVNPHAEKLRFVDHQPRTRRDHMKYLTLIRAIALLHQHQRPLEEIEHRGERVRYLEVEPSDIALAGRLADQVLGRSLDELAPQTRRLLELTRAMVEKAAAEHGVVDARDYPFSRRELREHTGWSQTQLRVHLERLVEMEYVLARRGRQGQSYHYSLVWDGRGRDGARFVPGLLEPDATTTTSTSRGSAPDLAGGWRPDIEPKAGGWRAPESTPIAATSKDKSARSADKSENARPGNGKSRLVAGEALAVHAAAAAPKRAES